MPHDTYINSVIEELDSENKSENLNMYKDVDPFDSFSENPSALKAFANQKETGYGIKSDLSFAKSGLLLNKDLISKIKDIKSNLGTASKVLFNDFLKRFNNNDYNENFDNHKKKRKAKKPEKEFDISSELIREKLKVLPKDKRDKARKFAYSLVSKGLASGYAASLNKHELAKQLIYHAASWKPTKLGSISREKEIDTALSVAWKAAVDGTWKIPLELAKAEVLEYEFRYYRRKYQESGILSQELKSLESEVDKLLGRWYNLTGKIEENPVRCNTSEVSANNYGNNKFDEELVNQDYLQIDYPATEQQAKYSIDLSYTPDEQKYLKLTPSENDDSIKLDTIDGKEYFLKLKELEMNDLGELVMTLKPIAKEVFLELALSPKLQL